MEAKLIPFSASPPPEAAAVLVLAPHPDDEVFGCGGAIMLHAQAGARVHVAVMTDGAVFGDPQVRRAESRRAAEVLGVEAPEFWGLPDQGVLYGEALVARIAGLIDILGVQVLYAPSLWENHPDHRATALAAREAVRRQDGCVLMAYEVGAALRPNRLLDISAVRDRKREAMQCFTSQLALQSYDRHLEALNVFRTYTLGATVEAAEAFEFADAQMLRARAQDYLVSEYARQREAGLVLLPEDTDVVSVLIRSMGRPELERALSSVAVQTWPRVEVVVVNARGEEHPPLPPWCGRFPLRLVDDGRPLQRSAAANRALEAAQGDALLFLDDDDWLEPDHLAKLVQGLESRPDAIAAVTGVRALDTQGKELLTWVGRDGTHRLMLANQMPIMSVLFRRSWLNGARFDEGLDIYEDWDFWLQLGERGTFVGVPGISASYLIRPFDGSGVHQKEVAATGLRRIREKWRGRWPDSWYDRLEADLVAMEGRWLDLQQQVRDASGTQQADRVTIAELSQALAAAQTAQQRAQEHHLTMEHLRNVAEHQRAIAEQHRSIAEQLRADAEQQRSIAEQQKTHAEQQRADAEQQRLHAEQQRVDAEQQKTHAEQQRADAEQKRLHAEQQRLEAEQRYGQLEQQWAATEQLRSQLQLERDALVAELGQARQVSHGLQAQLTAVFNSRSWRLAAPLRLMGRAARHMLGR